MITDTPLIFRPAVSSDARTLLDMVNAMADADHCQRLEPEAQNRLVKDAFEKKRFEIVFAEWQGNVAGYAAFYQGYSTFEARPTLYIDDLYVKNEYRGRHVAYELFRHLLREAKQRDCGRVEWMVAAGNEEAFGFYERLRAKKLQDWTHYRLNRDDIEKMA
jgi:ribosomal protein S18 acetylase RimI-like enzyme